jgi:hypothetical protein
MRVGDCTYSAYKPKTYVHDGQVSEEGPVCFMTWRQGVPDQTRLHPKQTTPQSGGVSHITPSDDTSTFNLPGSACDPL